MTNTNSPRLGCPQVVYKNKFFQVRRIEADFGAFAKEYFVVDAGTHAAMVVVRAGSLLMVRQYRLLIDGLSWEIPGGRVDDGETPEEAAVRECLEETGIQCLNAHPLISYQGGMDTNNNPTHLFYCEEVSKDIDLAIVDDKEVLGSDWIPLPRCMEMIFEGQVVDSISILAILAYHTVRTARI